MYHHCWGVISFDSPRPERYHTGTMNWPINHVIPSRRPVALPSKGWAQRYVRAVARPVTFFIYFIFIICVSIQWLCEIVGMGIEGEDSTTDHWGKLSSCIYKNDAITTSVSHALTASCLTRQINKKKKKRSRPFRDDESPFVTSPRVVIKCKRDFIVSAKRKGGGRRMVSRLLSSSSLSFKYFFFFFSFSSFFLKIPSVCLTTQEQKVPHVSDLASIILIIKRKWRNIWTVKPTAINTSDKIRLVYNIHCMHVLYKQLSTVTQ